MNSIIKRFLLNDQGELGPVKLAVPEGSEFLSVSPNNYLVFYAIPSEPTDNEQEELFLFLKVASSVNLDEYQFVGLCCGFFVFKA